MDTEVIRWLLRGDASIKYQVQRDLRGETRPDLQARIATEGWGARFLARRNSNGHWGRGFYQPKWISTHYTLLDLKNLNIAQDHPLIAESVDLVVREHKGQDGGINPAKTIPESDVCVNGMFLNYACYFGVDEGQLRSVIDYVLEQRMEDGGFNCEKNRPGARHSSMHSTISLLEGIHEYARQGYGYRLRELQTAANDAREFLLMHQLYKSDHTGEVIRASFLRLSYPGRWYYDILRALDYFQDAQIAWDERMRSASAVLLKKRKPDGRWPLQAKIHGQFHFEMEKPGQPSRWNTLRAGRVFKAYSLEDRIQLEAA